MENDIFAWLMNNGDVLNGAVIARLLCMGIVIEFLGIVASTFGRLSR